MPGGGEGKREVGGFNTLFFFLFSCVSHVVVSCGFVWANLWFHFLFLVFSYVCFLLGTLPFSPRFFLFFGGGGATACTSVVPPLVSLHARLCVLWSRVFPPTLLRLSHFRFALVPPPHPPRPRGRCPPFQNVLFPAPGTKLASVSSGTGLSYPDVGGSPDFGGGGGGATGGVARWAGSDDASSLAGDAAGGAGGGGGGGSGGGGSVGGGSGYGHDTSFPMSSWASPVSWAAGAGAAGGGGGQQMRLGEAPGQFWELYGCAEEGEGATGNVVLALDVLGSFDFYSIPADAGIRGVVGEVRQHVLEGGFDAGRWGGGGTSLFFFVWGRRGGGLRRQPGLGFVLLVCFMMSAVSTSWNSGCSRRLVEAQRAPSV